MYDENPRDTTVKVPGYNKDSETAACPGDRAPDAPLLIDVTDDHKRDRLFGIFSPSHHSVLFHSEIRGTFSTGTVRCYQSTTWEDRS